MNRKKASEAAEPASAGPALTQPDLPSTQNGASKPAEAEKGKSLGGQSPLKMNMTAF